MQTSFQTLQICEASLNNNIFFMFHSKRRHNISLKEADNTHNEVVIIPEASSQQDTEFLKGRISYFQTKFLVSLHQTFLLFHAERGLC